MKPASSLPTAALFAVLCAVLAAGCGGPPRPLDPPMSFTLQNELGQSVYTQRAACGQEAWLSIFDATGQEIGLAGSSGCLPACGAPLRACPAIACIAPAAEELKPAMNLAETWNGVFERINSKDHCVEDAAAEGELMAVACWGDAPAGNAGAGNPGEIQNQRCTRSSFKVIAGADIRFVTTAF